MNEHSAQLRLVQYRASSGRESVAAWHDGEWREIPGLGTTYELVCMCLDEGSSLTELVHRLVSDRKVDLVTAEAEGRLLPAIRHPDPSRLHLTGTGLTHLGSAEGRDKMHKAAAAGSVTDSMRMFLMGLEQGKPETGAGCQPEWFYKGNGNSLVGPADELRSPSFALDGGEEPEIAGIYIIDAEKQPRRLGFTLANEFSDHVTERHNYLWLAHSKLRPAAIGAEILIGELPTDVRGRSRIIRDNVVLWDEPFLTGETNMSHTIANLEHHHFKYEVFRRPGDIHVHFFGTATLSFAQSVSTQAGDIFEIEAEPFSLKLRNRLRVSEAEEIQVCQL